MISIDLSGMSALISGEVKASAVLWRVSGGKGLAAGRFSRARLYRRSQLGAATWSARLHPEFSMARRIGRGHQTGESPCLQLST
jgi:hypothetical protein